MRPIPLLMALAAVLVAALAAPADAAGASSRITVRTETFPRPPYSEATYYIYESEGRTVCTKLSVCNKYDQCSTQYVPGAFREAEDTGESRPYGTSAAADIAASSLPKHVCLTRFGLTPRR